MSYFLLPPPKHDDNHLPVPFASPFHHHRRFIRREVTHDTQIVREFRAKLQLAEEMISKLAFSLGEIRIMKSDPQSRSQTNRKTNFGKVAKILRVGVGTVSGAGVSSADRA